MNDSPTENPRIWVVETWHRGFKRWAPFDARVNRNSAWALMREYRRRWPHEKFRTVAYGRSS